MGSGVPCRIAGDTPTALRSSRMDVETQAVAVALKKERDLIKPAQARQAHAIAKGTKMGRSPNLTTIKKRSYPVLR